MNLTKFFQTYLLLIIVYFGCAFSFAQTNVVGGFTTLSITCFLVTYLSTVLLLKDSHLRKIVLITFIIKTIIGISHFLIFYDSSYFSSGGMIRDVFQNDFTSYFNFVRSLAYDKESLGIFYYDSSEQVVSHQELLNLMTIFMYKFGVYAMNIIPLNCMFSSLFAINMYICLEQYCDNRQKKTGLVVLLALFPLFLDDAIFVRDIMGQFLMSIGVVLFSRSSKSTRFIWLIPASYLFFLQRTAYVVTPFLVYLIILFTDRKQTKYLILIPIVMVIAASILPEMGVGNEFSERSGRGGIMSTSIAMLPVRIVFGLIGPFPWTQFIVKGLVEPAFASQLYQYIAGIIHIGALILLISTRGLFKNLCKDGIFLIGLVVVGMGVLDSHMHITYIMAGSCFMVPLIYLFTSKQQYKKAMLISFLILLSLNIIWIGLGMSGIKTELI